MANRFYKTVSTASADGGFHVTLDGRVLKTPGKMQLVCLTETQAKHVADEWDAQEKEIKPETMPCTRLMNVACEMTPDRRPELIAEFRKYCETDLLSYRAAHPEDLNARQQSEWQPLLEWVAQKHSIALATTTGLAAVKQSEASLNAASTFADALDDAKLTLLLHLTASFGSGVLALATVEKHLTAERAFALANLDESFQNERWGEDDEAIARNAALLVELNALAHLI